MAHEIDLTTGSAAFAFAGANAWHGLGNRLTPGAPIEQWITEAGLEYKVQASPVRYDFGGDIKTADGRIVLHRNDTGAALGVATEGYHIVQPSEVVEFFRDLCADHGFVMETAGALRGGARYWALARTPLVANLTKGMDDKAVMYLLMASSADCTLASIGLGTPTRVVCANTMSMALQGENENRKSVKTSHRSAFDAAAVKIKLGTSLTGGLTKAFETYVSAMTLLNDKPVKTDVEARAFYAMLLKPEIAVVPNADKLETADLFRKSFGIAVDYIREDDLKTGDDQARAIRGLDGVMRAYNRAPGAMPGTLRGLVEGMTHFVDHGRGVNAEKRMDSAALGQGATLKARTLDAALALAV